MKHRAVVTTETDSDGHMTIILTCDACRGVRVTCAAVHVAQLAQLLPRICAAAGLDLTDVGGDIFFLGGGEG